ncbi:MAG: AzlD domain-containing protein [Alphaproteobacteria bacterium]
MADEAYLWLLVGLGFLATYALRIGGVLIAGRIRPDGAAIGWINAVAVAIAAGLGVRVIVSPGGALAETPTLFRLVSLAIAFVIFFGFGRNVLLGMAAGVVAFGSLLLMQAGGF